MYIHMYIHIYQGCRIARAFERLPRSETGRGSKPPAPQPLETPRAQKEPDVGCGYEIFATSLALHHPRSSMGLAEACPSFAVSGSTLSGMA